MVRVRVRVGVRVRVRTRVRVRVRSGVRTLRRHHQLSTHMGKEMSCTVITWC